MNAELMQQAATMKAAIARYVEILTPANTLRKCEEAVHLDADIAGAAEHDRPLQ
jgi:hypothetical protein